MKRTDIDGGGYELIAADGMQLVTTVDGEEIRADSVIIPTGETLNTWTEAIKVEPIEVDTKQLRIAELEAELARLKAE